MELLIDRAKAGVSVYVLRCFNIQAAEKWETAERSGEKGVGIIRDKLERRHVKSEDTEIAHRETKQTSQASCHRAICVVKDFFFNEVFRNRRITCGNFEIFVHTLK